MSQKNTDMNIAKIACFLALLMRLRSHKTCNQGHKYVKMCRTILCINICNLFNEGVRPKRAKSYFNLNLKFHDYSIFLLRLTYLLLVSGFGSSTVDQVPEIYSKYKYWSSTHFFKKKST